MSGDSLPISLDKFAVALKDLPLSSLYAKSRELHNSVMHLRSSNSQLEEYVSSNGPDKECAEAIRENEETIQRMEARILAVEYEVVVERGQPWSEEEGGKELGKGTGDAQARAEANENGQTEASNTTNDDGSEGMYL